MNWIGRTSPDDVTVDLSSGREATLTTVTSGVSERVAKMLATTITNKTSPADMPITILPLRLNAIVLIFLSGELINCGLFTQITKTCRQAITTTKNVMKFQKQYPDPDHLTRYFGSMFRVCGCAGTVCDLRTVK
jgi:hypothetical protein